MNRTHLIRKFETENRRYVYDAWTNAILEVDEVVYGLLPQVLQESLLPLSAHYGARRALREIEKAIAQGYFRSGTPRIESFPEKGLDEAVDLILEQGPDGVVLNVTERCNLRCRYCAFSGAYPLNRVHGQQDMSWPTAKATLNWYFRFSERPDFRIGFYGGEPLLVRPLLERIVSHARERVGEKARFNLTTNATRLTHDACRFLIQENFTVTVSLDGPEQVHDRYRVNRKGQGSFAGVMAGLRRLRDLDPNFYRKHVLFNMVLAPPVQLTSIRQFIDSHPGLFEGMPIMTAPVSPHPSEVAGRLQSENPAEEAAQRSTLYGRYMDQLSKAGRRGEFEHAYYGAAYTALHLRPMTVMGETTASHGQCVPGSRKAFVDTNGDIYMCERVSPAWAIGRVPQGIHRERVLGFLRAYNQFFADRCRRCWAVRLCEKCVNSVRVGQRFSEERADQVCRKTRAGLTSLLRSYCEIREARDDAFDWAEQVEAD